MSDAYGPQGRSAWMDEDWRAHQRWVEVRERPVNVVLDGPPDAEQAVVFVHGLSGCWQNWLENIPAFAAAGRRVVALDLPGFGASPMPAEHIEISLYADIVDETLTALGIGAPVAVVGNSMGGHVAAEMAIRHPARVERLVLVSAAGIASIEQRNERALGLLRRGDVALTAYFGWWATRSEQVARRARLRAQAFAIVAAHPSRLPAPLVAEQLRGSGKPGFVDALDTLTNHPIEQRLTEVACPTLVVWGDHDRLVPVRDADRFVAAIPNARKVVYADTGHVPMLERPARFNADVLAFLDEDPGERVGQAQEQAAGTS